MSELTSEEKAAFKSATERRRANGIRLKRITLCAEASQVQGFNEIWEVWVERYGKNSAVDVLLRLMSTVEARIREEDARRSNKT